MTITLLTPLAGWATPLAEVPDPVFAEAMLGEGAAVDPVEGRLVAPADGTVVSVHPAGHAVTIACDAGPVVLIHVGLETVGLGGAGFSPQVRDGQRVAAGDLLLAFDLDVLARRAKSLVTPIIVTNGEAFAIASAVSGRAVAAGEPLLMLRAVAAATHETAAASVQHQRTLRLPLAHGLHARPAARVAALVAEKGVVELVAADGRSASARSPVAMLALALPHGAAVTLRGEAAAVVAVAELLESGMGELLPVVDAPAPLVSPVVLPEALAGVVAAPGSAIGPAFRLREAAMTIVEQGTGVIAERAALAAAQHQVRAALAQAAAQPGAAGAIAAAHLAFLDDPALAEAAEAAIARGKSAGFGWRGAIAAFVAPLEAAGDARFAERVADLKDLERRVLAALTGAAVDGPAIPPGAILIADDLFPSDLAARGAARPAGIATAAGGATSHAAIIAAGLGIPMLVALGPALALIEDGTDLILGGGRLRIAPDAATLAAARAEAATRAARRHAAQARAHEPARTADGTRIELFANLGSAADAARATAEGAEGCGLLRTEFLFLDRATAPGVDEQRATYQAIADALGDRPLIVRTLDIGADKPAPYLPMAAEENPALGLRGIRLQLARPDLLEAQLRALLGVRGQVQIMLPMIADLAELRETRALLTRLAADAGVALPPLGIMIETPAAALIAPTLAAEADFFSIGTNDLSQYTLARDRTNPAVAAGLDALHPAVLRLIGETAGAGRPAGVCGGLAADAAAVPLLIGLGVTELSVPPAAVAESKALVRTLSIATCRDLAARALAAPDAAAVRALVPSILEQAA